MEKFPCLSRPAEEVNKIRRQFDLLRITPLHHTILKDKREDSKWVKIGEITDGDGNLIFAEVADMMLNILTFFNSNAECERIFNMVRKVKGELQGHMTIPTLTAKCVSKSFQASRGVECHEFNPSRELLRACKSATHQYNTALKNRREEREGDGVDDDEPEDSDNELDLDFEDFE